jgi:signal transduction histidine kinase
MNQYDDVQKDPELAVNFGLLRQHWDEHVSQVHLLLSAVERGDADMTRTVFDGITRSTFEHSKVTLNANAHNGVVEIAVEDRGVGIPQDEIGRVRERYYRASNVGSIPGTGMGLHLVDEIVRQHGGRLDIASVEGQGTRIAVLLPLEGPSVQRERDVAQDLVRGGRQGDSELAGGGADRARLCG